MKEEALKLADELSQYTINDGVDDLNKRTIAMIRRLVEELDKLIHDNEELLKSLTAERKQIWCDCGDSIEPNCGAICGNCLASMNTTPQTKPLSDEEILVIADKFIERFEYEPCNVDEIGFARAIEERHGIHD